MDCKRLLGFWISYCQHIEADTEGTHIQVESHSTVASLKDDLRITIAWGFPCIQEFKEKWANQFPDSAASSHFIDFLFNGVLVFRDLYVNVDGGRCMLPLPAPQTDTKSGDITGLEVLREKYTLVRLLNSLVIATDFDNYLKRAGIRVVEKPWIR